jgi:hypothetical protein
MSRTLAILFPIILIGIAVIGELISEIAPEEGNFTQLLIVSSVSQVAFVVGLFMYCMFAALHSTQYLSLPKDRSLWLIVIIGANIIGACIYYMTTYQTFRKAGKGGLMSFK